MPPYAGYMDDCSNQDDFWAKKLKIVRLPDNVACLGCGKIKDQSCFSNRQLQELAKVLIRKEQQGRKGKDQAFVRCRQCTGGQMTEMTCNVCDLTLDLDAFAKVHRKNPDQARCMKCMQAQMEAEFGDDTEVDGESDSDDSDSSDRYTVSNDGGDFQKPDADDAVMLSSGCIPSSSGLSRASTLRLYADLSDDEGIDSIEGSVDSTLNGTHTSSHGHPEWIDQPRKARPDMSWEKVKASKEGVKAGLASNFVAETSASIMSKYQAHLHNHGTEKNLAGH